MKNKNKKIIFILSSLVFVLTSCSTQSQLVNENSISYILLKTHIGIDLLFSLIGGLIGGLVYLAIILTDQSRKVILSKIGVLSNMFVSTCGGLLMFLLTESNTWMKIEDNLFQLAVIIIFGATSIEGWATIKKRFLKSISGNQQE